MSVSFAPRILLVDDHALFRTGLGLIVGDAFPGAEVMEAPTRAAALAMSPATALDLILLDVHLPDANGLTLIAALQEHFGEVPVLVVSADDDIAQVAQARERGAVGFLSKLASGERIVTTLRDCLAGRHAFASTHYALPPAVVMLKAAEPTAQPSERQRAILELLGEGMPNKAIARQVGLSENDVRAEVSWLTEMLDATNREQAYEAALQRGWLKSA